MRKGWLVLGVVVVLAACGGPEITDLDANPTATNPTGSSTPGSSPTPVESGTPTPGAAPTVTNVPSFATWDANIRTAVTGNCDSCHAGGSGGWSWQPNNNDETIRRYQWFTTICNRDGGVDNAGVLSYSPATGRLRNVFCNQGVAAELGPNGAHDGGNVAGGLCATIENYLATGGATTPPNCNDNYDLANSN